MGAKLAGASPILGVDPVPAKTDMARALGADEGFQPDGKVLDAIRARTGERGADYAFDATGIPEVQEHCFEAVRPGGTAVLAGLSPMDSETRFPSSVVTRQEKTLMGSYCGTANPARDFPLYADMYLKGKLDLDLLLTRTYSLAEINQAFEDMLAGKNARGMILFE